MKTRVTNGWEKNEKIRETQNLERKKKSRNNMKSHREKRNMKKREVIGLPCSIALTRRFVILMTSSRVMKHVYRQKENK